jgi:hypothetical protein
MCLRRAPEKYIAGAALDRAGLGVRYHPDPDIVIEGKLVNRCGN